jgi:choline dehydrogenase-like flavoprotein
MMLRGKFDVFRMTTDTLDYLIVGGGSAGCVLAARLSEDPEVQVGLIEAGPADRSIFIHCPAGLMVLARTGWSNWGFQTVPQPGLNGRRGYQPRGKTLGGSSSVNAMIYTRGHPQDYETWAAAGNPGWAWADVLPYFKLAEHNERHEASSNGAWHEWHGNSGPLNVADLRSPNPYSAHFVQAGEQAGYPHTDDFNGPQQEGVGLYQVTQKNGQRYSAAQAYLAPALGRRNLHVLTGAQVTRLLFAEAQDGSAAPRVNGVEFLQGRQRRQLRAAREVLLCAGALQSPQVLMLSGIGPGAHLQAQGIAVKHDLPGVGLHLQDHIDAPLVFNAPHLTKLAGLSVPGALNALRGIFEWRRSRSGLLTTNFAEVGGFIRSRASEPIPDLQLHFVIGKLIDHGRTTPLGHGYSCHVCLLRPQSRGSVQLSGPDPAAVPRIDPNFLAEPGDMERLMRGFKLMRGILSQPALARFGAEELPASAGARNDAQIEEFIRNHADTIYHPAGTCRMGPDPRSDVVDARLRVHGLRGLRVVDASIMPTLVGANTNAPTIMIAEKAADMIQADAAAAAG